MLKECSPVKYVDHEGVEHDALVTEVHGPEEWNQEFYSVNLVYITKDASKRDSYGAQLERDTSVVHKDNQSALGNYWFEA